LAVNGVDTFPSGPPDSFEHSGYFILVKYMLAKQLEALMSKVCQVTGKRPVTGNNVSHSMRKTRRRFLPNLHTHRFWVESENRFVKLRVSTKGMRIIDKNGIDAVLVGIRKRGDAI